jgi:hypothetical protein
MRLFIRKGMKKVLFLRFYIFGYTQTKQRKASYTQAILSSQLGLSNHISLFTGIWASFWTI